MKKITLSLMFATSIYFGFSQNLILLDEHDNEVTNSIVDIPIANGGSVVYQIPIINTIATPDTMKVARRIQSINGDDMTTFCWGGVCYSSATDTSGQSFSLLQNDTVDFDTFVFAGDVGWGFHATFSAGTVCNNRLVHYIFYNISNPNDTVGVTLRYMCSTGVLENSTALSGSISDAFPNPTSNQTTIHYKLNNGVQKGAIIIYDMLGNEIKHIGLSTKEGVEKINTQNFSSGIYFYSLLADGKMIATKKLVVASN